MQRRITEQEERCYRLRHHDFEGLTTQETAKKMKISLKKVRWLLKDLQVKAPQLFPILTHRQYLIYKLYVNTGLSQCKIAKYMDTIQSSIWTTLNRLKKKGMPFLKPSGFGDIITYEKEIDDHIIHKF